MEIQYFSDIYEFYNKVKGFLIVHEAANNLIFGILNALKQDIHTYSQDQPPRLIIITQGNKILLVSIRTPPYSQVISYTNDLDTISLLTEKLTKNDPLIPGIFGFKEGAREFVKHWQEKREVKPFLEMHEKFHQLDQVNLNTLGSHSLEVATQKNSKLIADWNIKFLNEALPDSSPEEITSNQQRLPHLIQQQKIYLLSSNDKFLSMARKSGDTPNGQTISGVYTPPNLRNKGYGTEVVAKLSKLALDEGKKFCFLSTDLANPTSNRIYYKIGYRPIIDMDVWRFSYI